MLSTRLSIRKRGGSLGHYQSMEKDGRFSHFRGRVMGQLVMTLGAMAAEHVFYGENSQGVGGDVQSATATGAAMVGMWAMGPDPVHIAGSLELDDDREAVLKRLERIGSTIMNRAGSPGLFGDNPVGAVLGSPDKKRAAAQILGQAYITAYALMDANREGLEKIADALVPPTPRASGWRSWSSPDWRSRRWWRRSRSPPMAAAARLPRCSGRRGSRPTVGTRAPVRSPTTSPPATGSRPPTSST